MFFVILDLVAGKADDEGLLTSAFRDTVTSCLRELTHYMAAAAPEPRAQLDATTGPQPRSGSRKFVLSIVAATASDSARVRAFPSRSTTWSSSSHSFTSFYCYYSFNGWGGYDRCC